MSQVDWHFDSLEPWVSAGVRKTVAMAEIPEVMPRAFNDVAATVQAAGVGLTGPAYACYYGKPSEIVDVEVGFGIDRVAELPGLVVTERPATKVVIGTFVGPYDQLSAAYGTLPGWLAEHPAELGPDMFELYDSEPDAEPPITRMAFPLA